MPSNAQARVRSSFLQARPTDDMPEWVRNQFAQTSGQFQREDGSIDENWLAPGHIVRDAQGRRVVLLGDNRQLEGTNDLAMNPDYNPETDAYYDPDLGWVASGDKVNDSPWRRTHSRNRAIAAAAMSIFAGGAAGYGLGAEGAGAGWAEGGGFGAGGISPEAAAGVGAGDAATGAGAGWAADGGFGAGGLAPEEMGVANYEAGAGLTGSTLSPQNIARAVNTARNLLGGGGGQGRGGSGGMPIMGGFGGSAARIGDHQANDDPYGLKAIGWGGGFVKQDNPRQKLAEALMGRNPWSYNDEN